MLFARFIPLVRSFISLAAGLAEMTFGKFSVFTTIGCAAWCVAVASLGYSLGSSRHHFIKAFSYAGYVAGVLVVIFFAVVIGHRIVTLRHERAAESAAGGGDCKFGAG